MLIGVFLQPGECRRIFKRLYQGVTLEGSNIDGAARVMFAISWRGINSQDLFDGLALQKFLQD